MLGILCKNTPRQTSRQATRYSPELVPPTAYDTMFPTELLCVVVGLLVMQLYVYNNVHNKFNVSNSYCLQIYPIFHLG